MRISSELRASSCLALSKKLFAEAQFADAAFAATEFLKRNPSPDQINEVADTVLAIAKQVVAEPLDLYDETTASNVLCALLWAHGKQSPGSPRQEEIAEVWGRTACVAAERGNIDAALASCNAVNWDERLPYGEEPIRVAVREVRERARSVREQMRLDGLIPAMPKDRSDSWLIKTFCL